MSNPISDDFIMPFGKYEGMKIADVPDEYLLWLYDNQRCYREVKQYIIENLDAIRANVKQNQTKK